MSRNSELIHEPDNEPRDVYESRGSTTTVPRVVRYHFNYHYLVLSGHRRRTNYDVDVHVHTYPYEDYVLSQTTSTGYSRTRYSGV